MSDDPRIRAVLARSGGFAGRTIRRGLDTADLTVTEAATLRALVAALPPASPGGPPAAGPDRFTYAIEVDTDGHPQVHRFAEPPPDEARGLIQLLSRAPLLPAR